MPCASIFLQKMGYSSMAPGQTQALALATGPLQLAPSLRMPKQGSKHPWSGSGRKRATSTTAAVRASASAAEAAARAALAAAEADTARRQAPPRALPGPAQSPQQ